jgi:hypothetical protein
MKKKKQKKQKTRIRQSDILGTLSSNERKVVKSVMDVAGPEFRARMMTSNPFAVDGDIRTEGYAAIARTCQMLDVRLSSDLEDKIVVTVRDLTTVIRQLTM